MTFTVPIRPKGGMNVRDGHWAARAKRVKAERAAVAAYAPLPWVWRQLAAESDSFRVTLLRVSPRRMDDDGWVSNAKAVRDEVARLLGIDDGSPRLVWHYGQERGEVRQHLVRITVETM